MWPHIDFEGHRQFIVQTTTAHMYLHYPIEERNEKKLCMESWIEKWNLNLLQSIEWSERDNCRKTHNFE